MAGKPALAGAIVTAAVAGVVSVPMGRWMVHNGAAQRLSATIPVQAAAKQQMGQPPQRA